MTQYIPLLHLGGKGRGGGVPAGHVGWETVAASTKEVSTLHGEEK